MGAVGAAEEGEAKRRGGVSTVRLRREMHQQRLGGHGPGRIYRYKDTANTGK